MRRYRSGRAGLAAIMLTLAGGTLGAADSRDLGRSLFQGEAALTGQIAGQGLPLPVQASRCVNCHLATIASSASGASSPREPASPAANRAKLGPALNAGHLLHNLARRGGPPSHYDSATFCRVLRTGIDPAWVIVDRNMPRYNIGTRDCDALWTYLTGGPS